MFTYSINMCMYMYMCCSDLLSLPLSLSLPQLFLTQGKDVLVEAKDFGEVEPIGRGAFATVFKAKYKSGKAVRALPIMIGPPTPASLSCLHACLLSCIMSVHVCVYAGGC